MFKAVCSIPYMEYVVESSQQLYDVSTISNPFLLVYMKKLRIREMTWFIQGYTAR